MGAAVTDEFADKAEQDFQWEGEQMTSGTNMFACTEEPEACCAPFGECVMTDPMCCADQGGNSRGPGSDCALLPEMRSDFNNDGDVDWFDFWRFGRCLAGPNVIEPPDDCPANDFTIADTDCDNDVDLEDYRIFQTDFTGKP